MGKERARKLRRSGTKAEQKLWRALRDRGLAGAKFRRQTPIGPYVVDFVCFDARLVIEIDGGQHANNNQQDERRTAWLQSEGYRVIRFWNNDVIENLAGVLHAIESALDYS